MTVRAGLTFGMTDDDARDVMFALHGYLPGMATYVSDQADAFVKAEPDWAAVDAFANDVKQLHAVARLCADLGQALAGRAEVAPGAEARCGCPPAAHCQGGRTVRAEGSQ